MPELPEVETVRRGLAQAMTGATFTAIEQRRAGLRFPFPERFAERLRGRRVEAVGRRAKYLVVTLDDGSVLAAHLGMTGSFRVVAGGGAEERAVETTPGSFYYGRGQATAPGGTSPHDHLRFVFDTGTAITYNDPRRFGFMVLVEPGGFDAHPLFRDIGVEPLGAGFDARVLARLMAGRAAPLKSALLDQKLIAGLGNIYVCEALHRAGLSPQRAAGTLAKPDGAPTAGGEAAGHRDPDGARGGGGGRRLDAEGFPPRRRRARHLPARVPRLRPARTRPVPPEVPGRHRADRAERAVDLLLRQLPALRPAPTGRCGTGLDQAGLLVTDGASTSRP